MTIKQDLKNKIFADIRATHPGDLREMQYFAAWFVEAQIALAEFVSKNGQLTSHKDGQLTSEKEETKGER
jgi:hypothetical protein